MPSVSFRTLIPFDNNWNGSNAEYLYTDDLENFSLSEGLGNFPSDFRFFVGDDNQIALCIDETRQLFKTTDAGQTWNYITDVTNPGGGDFATGGWYTNGRWYVVSHFGSIWHSDDGSSFTYNDNGSFTTEFVNGGGVVANASNSRVVSVAFNGGPSGNFAYKLSTDNGNTWPTSYSGAMSQDINPIAVVFFNDLFLAIGQYVASSAGSSGSSWSTNGTVRNFAAAAVDSDRIVAIDINGDVFHATDGTTYTDTTWNLGRSLTAHAESTQMFYKGGGLVLIDDVTDQISWSTDQGQTWSHYSISPTKDYYPRTGFVLAPAGPVPFQELWTNYVNTIEVEK